MGMKTAKSFSVGKRILAWVCAGFAMVSVVKADGVSAATREGNEMFVVRNGETAPMTTEVVFPGDIRVMTNGTFTVKGGPPRTLKNGDRLQADGMLLQPDGRIEPVFDHITKVKNRVVIVRNGQSETLTQPFTLGNGGRVDPNATILKPDGSLYRLLDGQLLKLSGEVIPAKDTITLQDGKVVVQMDGSLITVPEGRSFMMNNGTKVFGDGTVIRPDGTQFKLTKGQIVTIPGIVNNY